MSLESTLTIRRAVSADASLLADLGARTFSEAFAADPRNRPEDMDVYMSSSFTASRLEAELTDPLSTFLIAEIGGSAAGYAKIYAGDDAPECVRGARPIELARLYVSSEWYGREVGARLMQSCVDEARRGGYEMIWLGVWEHNLRARAFYRKWDFRDVGTHIFQLGSDPQTDILMERAV